MTDSSISDKRKQCVWIVRYGLTKFPLVESVGPFDGELDSTEGMDHAKVIAHRIGSSGSKAPRVVYSSPFVRCVHTAELIASDLSRSKVRIEEGLTEWQIPSLLVDPNGTKTFPQKAENLAQVYGTIDTAYQSVNPHASDDAVDFPEGAPHFQETEEALLLRCATTLTRILEHSDGESLAIVSHAPCDQAMALFLEAKGVSDSKLGPWPLGGITMFSRVVNDNTTGSQNYSYGEWELEFYGNTDHMPGKYKAGLKEWSLPCLDAKKLS